MRLSALTTPASIFVPPRSTPTTSGPPSDLAIFQRSQPDLTTARHCRRPDDSTGPGRASEWNKARQIEAGGSSASAARISASSAAPIVSCSIRPMSDPFERRPAVDEDAPSLGEGLVDDPADFKVDLAGRLLAARQLGAAGGRGVGRISAVALPAQDGAHAELQDHAADDRGGPAEVAGAAVGRLAQRDLLGQRAPQQAADRVLERGPGVQQAVVLGAVERVAERAGAAADDRDLVDRIGAREGCGRPARGRPRGTAIRIFSSGRSSRCRFSGPAIRRSMPFLEFRLADVVLAPPAPPGARPR